MRFFAINPNRADIDAPKDFWIKEIPKIVKSKSPKPHITGSYLLHEEYVDNYSWSPVEGIESHKGSNLKMTSLSSILRRITQQSRPNGLRYSSGTTPTSALAYKALHRKIAPLPTQQLPPSWSAPAAVSSILYETPIPSSTPAKRHILNCLVQNEPGVLSRVSGILAARGFNIDSLVVCNTEVEDLSRMTIVLTGHDGVVEQARRQLEDLVPVWAVLDYTDSPLVQRELLLAKISILGPEYFEELLAHHREMSATDAPAESVPMEAEEEYSDPENLSLEEKLERLVRGRRSQYHPRHLPPSQALRHKHEHLDHITKMTHRFGGKILDISTNNCIVEV